MYRVSYMYGVVIGFLVTFILGYLMSCVLFYTGMETKEKIYVKDSINEINTDLFVPPIARKIKRNFERKSVMS